MPSTEQNRICEECGETFTPKQNHPRYKFCSYICKSRNRYKKDSASGKTKQWRQAGAENARIKQREYYQTNKSGRKDYVILKNAERRCLQRQSKALFDRELTSFVFQEAKRLQVLREDLTRIKWHVDHIIPIKGKLVCGLHVWNNFAVIPKVENLRKGNCYSVHD